MSRRYFADFNSEPQYKSPAFQSAIEPTPVPITALYDILSYQRFADTHGEKAMIAKYLYSLPDAREDKAGNIWVWVGENPTTMFSSHTDTVEKKTAEGRKKVTVGNGYAYIRDGGVLGADCGTGIWIMLNLIAAKVPGVYVFHREEECGGHGSLHAAKHHADLLEGVKRCIAFDRKSTNHIITYQSGGRCCSDEFADALAAALNDGTGFTFAGNDGGTFTDSANYTHLIPECTNLSVGYYDQHTKDECQDLTFVSALVNKLIAIDWESLPAVRDPAVVEEDEFDYRKWYGAYTGHHASDEPGQGNGGSTATHDDMVQAIIDFPDEVADILATLGYRPSDLIEELKFTYDCDVR